MNRLLVKTGVILACVAFLGCGREPSRLLRQGQLPIYDFPLYLTEGTAGRVWKVDSDRNKTLLSEGLSDPRGIATDRYQNVYVAEFGAGRVLKFPAGESNYEVLAEGLSAPSVVAVDSFGDVFVAQDGDMTVTRLSDRKVFATYSVAPTALAFGVDDTPVVGLYNGGKVFWGWDENTSPAYEMPNIVNASIDGTGRVYVAKGGFEDGNVTRFHQRKPEGSTLVADGLLGPAGIAVDLVGNIFIVEQGAARIVLITYDGFKYAWLSECEDPQYITFTQY